MDRYQKTFRIMMELQEVIFLRIRSTDIMTADLSLYAGLNVCRSQTALFLSPIPMGVLRRLLFRGPVITGLLWVLNLRSGFRSIRIL